MSLDYPDRSVWLAKRETWRNRHKHERLVWSRGTYNVGRTKHKARIWNAKRNARALKRQLKKAVGR